jgi:hypothetical protein
MVLPLGLETTVTLYARVCGGATFRDHSGPPLNTAAWTVRGQSADGQ